MMNPRVDWCYRTEPIAGLGGLSMDYPRGRVLGGSSAINGMIYMRGQAADYDGWRDLGNVGWGWEDVLPHFLRMEDYHGGADEFHQVGGEMHVEPMRISWPILDSCRQAAVEAGFKKTEDFNRGDNEGFGYFEVTQKNGTRWSGARGFLKPIRRRPNLAVLTRAQATKIIFDGKRAVGVEFRRGEESKIAKARGEVVLAGGGDKQSAVAAIVRCRSGRIAEGIRRCSDSRLRIRRRKFAGSSSNSSGVSDSKRRYR